MTLNLVPIRIADGWAVVVNRFGDEDPILKDGKIFNDVYYGEELLWMETIKSNGPLWCTDLDGFLLELGWYPEADPGGRYRLNLIHGDRSNVVLRYESTDRRQVCGLIERCLKLVSQRVSDDELRRLSVPP